MNQIGLVDDSKWLRKSESLDNKWSNWIKSYQGMVMLYENSLEGQMKR